MISVDADFPGGNIVLDSIDGDHIAVHQDLRDTTTDWFWWYLRLRHAAGRAVTVTFTRSNVIGVRGPAVSLDGGREWDWLGPGAVQGQSFHYSVPATDAEVRFAFAMPYTQANLDDFLARHAASPHLAAGTLCTTKKGRRADLLRLGKLDGSATRRILLTCRHHSCEAAASYSLEGIMEAILADTDSGAWLRENAEVMIIPFVDKDGVEDGDQGKNRAPRDHNRDYSGVSVHATTAAIRNLVPAWSGGRLCLALDLHCPGARGKYHEHIYFPGGPEPGNWASTVRFGQELERVQSGSLVFSTENNLPYGQGWNVDSDNTQGLSFARWAAALPGVEVSATTEIPYANASGQAVTQQSARAFGHDLARAIDAFVKETT
jgi:hypothetical protein